MILNTLINTVRTKRENCSNNNKLVNLNNICLYLFIQSQKKIRKTDIYLPEVIRG